MTNSSNRRSKSSNKSIKPKDQVVDVTPLNSNAQSKTSSKIQSSSTEKVSSTNSIPGAKIYLMILEVLVQLKLQSEETRILKVIQTLALH